MREHRCACSRKYDASTQTHTYGSVALGILSIPTGCFDFELGQAARDLSSLVRHLVERTRAVKFFLFHALTELTAVLGHAREPFNIVQRYQLPGQ